MRADVSNAVATTAAPTISAIDEVDTIRHPPISPRRTSAESNETLLNRDPWFVVEITARGRDVEPVGG